MKTYHIQIPNLKINGKTKSRKWTVVITYITGTGHGILSKNFLDGKILNKHIFINKLFVIPDKLVAKRKKIDKKRNTK